MTGIILIHEHWQYIHAVNRVLLSEGKDINYCAL